MPYAASSLSLALLTVACAATPLERFAPVPGGTLFVEQSGSGPTIVLIHGGQLDRRVFDAQFNDLCQDHRVIRYDVRGYGRSSDPIDSYRSHDDLVAVLDELDVDRAHLVGFSLGGRIALDAALSAPDRVASLVLVAPGISGWVWSEKDLSTFNAIRELAVDGKLVAATEAWLAHPWMLPAMEDTERADRVREVALDNARCWTHPFPDMPLSPPATGRLHEVRCPTVAIIGDRELASIQAIAAQIGREVDGASVQEVSGSGHVVPMEQPGELTRMIRNFVSAPNSQALP